jgi:hypothetical protein
MLMWSSAAKASKWVDTELRAAIRRRVDDTDFRLIPIMIDDTAPPALVADYRGFPLKKASDMDGIVREFCPEPEIDVVSRLQQRFLELVSKQFPENDEVRCLFCPVCASKNLSALIKHEPQFDERLYVVRCADCGWEQHAPGDVGWSACTAATEDDEDGDESIAQERPFEADLGIARATGFLFVAEAIEDSFIRGTLNILGLEDVSFEARVAGPPLQINVLGVTVVISFHPALQAFTGSAVRGGAGPQPSTTIVGLR